MASRYLPYVKLKTEACMCFEKETTHEVYSGAAGFSSATPPSDSVSLVSFSAFLHPSKKMAMNRTR